MNSSLISVINPNNPILSFISFFIFTFTILCATVTGDYKASLGVFDAKKLTLNKIKLQPANVW